jgi:hypothetical protein
MSEPEGRSGGTGKEEKAVALVSRLTQRIRNLQTSAQTVGREAAELEQDLQFLLLEITDHLTSLETLFQDLQKMLTRSNDRNGQKKAPKKQAGKPGRRRTTRTTKKPG